MMHMSTVNDYSLTSSCSLLQGNPWADVAFCCMPYFLPQIPYILALKTPLSEGIPTEAEFLKRYCHARGIEPPSPLDWSFYKCLALFRIASIAQGVGSRAKQV